MLGRTARFLPLVALALSGAPARADSVRLKPGARIVALGDSITRAGGYLALMRRVLDRAYPELRVEIVNAGMSGHKSPDMSARLRTDVIDRNPTVVTISCGVNDVWHGFNTPPRGVDLETYTRLMGKMVDDLRAATRADIYLLTPTILKEDLLSRENIKVEPYCEAVRRLAAEKGCTLVDLNAVFNLAVAAAQHGGAPGFHPTSDGVHMLPGGDFLMAAAILRAMGVPMTTILRESAPPEPGIGAGDGRLQYWGRWDLRKAASAGAVTVNAGSTLLLRFRGRGATLHFGVAQYPQRPATLWLQVDDGEWRVVQPSEELAVAAQPLQDVEHTVRVVVKGLNEWHARRWEEPLEISVVFRGLSLESGAELLAAPPRPARRVEYLGDSITDGVLVLYEGPPGGWDKARFPEYNDGRRGWAYQSALLAGAEPSVVGFGRHGLTIHGNGGVPPAFWSLPYIYAGAPADTTRPPDAVVVNLGTNDRNAPVEMFGALYRAYLEAIRKLYPRARILCLVPFGGYQREAIAGGVTARRGQGDAAVELVDTAGWIDPKRHTSDGTHLNLDGNRIAAEKVAAALRPVLASAP